MILPRRRTDFVLPLMAIVLVLTMAFSWRSWQGYDSAYRDATASRNIQDHNQRLLIALIDSEAGQRGFLLTGESSYLEPYYRGEELAVSEFGTLRQAVREEPEQVETLNKLWPLMAARQQQLQRSVAFREAGQDAKALELVDSEVGLHTMQEIRVLCARMQTSESLREVNLVGLAQRQGQQGILVVFLGTAVLAIGLTLALTTIGNADAQRVLLIADLHARSELLQKTLGSIGDAVIATDEKGNVTFLNHIASALTGWLPEDALGKPLEQVKRIFDENRNAAAESHFIRVVTAGSSVRSDNNILFHKNGLSVPIELTGTPILAANGALHGVVFVFRDLTESRRAKSERRRFEEQLQESAKMESLGVLAGGIAHEFNNVLLGMIGNADLALGASSQAEAAPLIESVIRSGDRAAGLVKQLLAYTGQGRVVFELLDLSEYLRESLPAIQASASAAVHFDVALPDQPIFIEADLSQLQQVLISLVSNAAESYDGRTGVVAVAVSKQHVDELHLEKMSNVTRIAPGDYACIEVSDSGCGMDEKTKSSIFEPFFSTKFTGRGLGLSAVAGILRSHHGAVSVASRAGEGTTFRVLFPALEESIVMPRAPVVEAARATLPDTGGRGEDEYVLTGPES